MDKMQLTKARLAGGVWEGELTAPDIDGLRPALGVMYLGQPVDGLEIAAKPNTSGEWTVRFPVPVDLIGDGIQTFIFVDKEAGAELESFSIVAGEGLDGDVRAEMNLLREELDLLKRAFRRHCNETQSQ